MNYFSFIPFELFEQILPYLNKDELLSFLSFYDVKDDLNWNIIYSLHFYKSKRGVDYEIYILWLSLEKLKEKLKLDYQLDDLINLKLLDLGNNNLTAIPEEIGDLINLQILNLDNNKLTKVPKAIGKLRNLQILNLGNNKITELPKEIGNLKNLQTLGLYRNKLTEIPKKTEQLTNLKILHLGNNELIKIPKEIASLSNLKELNLYDNNEINQSEVNKIRSLLPNTKIYY